MLKKISDQVRECYEHAERCARYAKVVNDSQNRKDLLRLEEQWLELARSFELTERISDFTKDATQRRSRYH
jgi:hypothetical protein